MTMPIGLPIKLRVDDKGLVPVVTQDAISGEVLMLAYANEEAVMLTLESREAHYYSRSRQEIWRKGATSGHTQRVIEVQYDCDEDALLYRVEQQGVACHTGARSCFYRSITNDVESELNPSIGAVMGLLQRVVDQRLTTLPKGSYVTKLHRRGVGYISQKLVEEAGETIVAALQDEREELIGEAADLLFHLTVLLREKNVSLQDVMRKLAERHEDKSRAGAKSPDTPQSS